VEEETRNSLLIAGIDAHICDKCIEQAHGIVLRKFKPSSKLTSDLLQNQKKLERSINMYWSRSN
jgi:ATP-dependent Clp protease ATP-binding subunit ClpX